MSSLFDIQCSLSWDLVLYHEALMLAFKELLIALILKLYCAEILLKPLYLYLKAWPLKLVCLCSFAMLFKLTLDPIHLLKVNLLPLNHSRPFNQKLIDFQLKFRYNHYGLFHSKTNHFQCFVFTFLKSDDLLFELPYSFSESFVLVFELKQSLVFFQKLW